MNDTNQPKSELKPRKRRKYVTKEERRRQWGVRPLPPLHTQPEEKREEQQS